MIQIKYLCIIFACLACFSCNNERKGTVLVDVNGQLITEKDFIAALEPKVRETYLQFKKQQLDKIVAQKLLEQEAKRRQVLLEALLGAEVFAKAVVNHEEVRTYYEKNKKEFRGKTSEDAEKEIEKFLEEQKRQVLVKKLLADITAKSKVQYFLRESK